MITLKTPLLNLPITFEVGDIVDVRAVITLASTGAVSCYFGVETSTDAADRVVIVAEHREKFTRKQMRDQTSKRESATMAVVGSFTAWCSGEYLFTVVAQFGGDRLSDTVCPHVQSLTVTKRGTA